MTKRLNSTDFKTKSSIFVHLCEKYGLDVDDAINMLDAECRIYSNLVDDREAELVVWARSINHYSDGIKDGIN